MNKKDKIAITLSVLYPLFLILVYALASPLLFYVYVALGAVLCVYWVVRLIKGDTNFLANKSNNTNTVKSDNLDYFSVADELLKWSDLKDKGAITADEYQKEKTSLLNREK